LTAAETLTDREGLSPAELIPLLEAAAEAAGTLNARATEAVKAKLAPGGKVDNAVLEREEHVAHGLAWISTYAEGIRQLADYAKRIEGEGRFGEMESLLSQIVAGEYLAQLAGGVTMSQG
jgi:(2S)-methylsuccinyl-CoA dehydrogenase